MNSDSLSVVIAYFDFSNRLDRRRALKYCIDSIDEALDVVLVCFGPGVESYWPDRTNVKLIHIESADVLWQKERFWNIAISHVNESCKYIAWLDADIVFTDAHWVKKVKKKLRHSHLVHMFRIVHDYRLVGGSLKKDDFSRESVISRFGKGMPARTYFESSGVSISLRCSPGFAWAARAATLRECGFPDFFILGCGDKALLAAAYGMHEEYSAALGLNKSMTSAYADWSKRFFARIRGKVGSIDNVVNHIAQGSYEDRRYSNRYGLISDECFDVYQYLHINEYGAWEWRKRDTVYEKRIRDYFEARGD